MADTLFDALFAPGLDLVFDMHGQEIEYRPEGGGWQTVLAVYNPSREVADTEGHTPLHSTERVVDIRRSDLAAAPTQRDKVRIGGAEFDVVAEPVPGKQTYRLQIDEARS